MLVIRLFESVRPVVPVFRKLTAVSPVHVSEKVGNHCSDQCSGIIFLLARINTLEKVFICERIKY